MTMPGGEESKRTGRYGPGSEPCEQCGWLLPQPPEPQVCSRCQTARKDYPPLLPREKLYLALMAMLAGQLDRESDQVFYRRLLFAHYRREAGGVAGTVAKSPAELRNQLAADAAIWRNAGCPTEMTCPVPDPGRRSE